MAYAQNLPPGDQQNSFMAYSAREWAEGDPAAAQAMIQELPEGASKDSFVGGLISGMAQNDPASAAELVLANFPKGTARHTVASSGVISSWIKTDPAAASQWAERHEFIGWTFQVWHYNNSDAAEQWLKTTSLPQWSIQQLLEASRRNWVAE